jgi:hypothetical protein
MPTLESRNTIVTGTMALLLTLAGSGSRPALMQDWKIAS